MTRKNIFYIFTQTLPVFFGYITLGIAFGLIFTNAGFAWYLAPLMSLIVFAGAAQFIAIGLIASGTPLTAILITQLLVNIRHIFYGLSLITKFKDCGKCKPYLIFALTDETYSLLTTLEVPKDCKPSTFYTLISIFDQSYWVLGTTLGAIAGNFIPFDLTGIDFSLTALFAILTIEQIKKTKDILPVLVGALTSVASIILWKMGIINDSSNILLVSICAGLAALCLCKRKDILKSENEVKEVENE